MKQIPIVQSTYPLRLMNTKVMLWSIVILAALASLTAVVVRGAAVEWAILVTCLMTIVISGIGPRLALQHIEVKRDWSSRHVDRNQYMLTTEINRKWRIPGVWYATIEYIQNESEIDSPLLELKQHYDPLFHRRMSQRFVLDQLSRGHYVSRQVELLVGDIFGLTILRKKIDLPLAFTVIPHRLYEQDMTYLSQLTSKGWTEQKQDANILSLTETKNEQDRLLHEVLVSGIVEGIKPYSEGDSIHRIYYHALSRGMGVHVLEEKEQLSQLKHIIFIDQYMPPMDGQMQIQQINTLIGWVIDRVSTALANGPILIVTDNWCYECYEYYQLEELRRLLASICPDVQYPITERLLSLAKILPSHSKLTVYTTDWKNNEGWTELAQLAWHKKVTVSLQLLTEHRIMTYSMREQQRELEQNGLQTIWRYSNYKAESIQLALEGSEVYAYD